jgi:hypothetical protein
MDRETEDEITMRIAANRVREISQRWHNDDHRGQGIWVLCELEDCRKDQATIERLLKQPGRYADVRAKLIAEGM